MLNRFRLFSLGWIWKTSPPPTTQNYHHARYITPSDTRWTLRSGRTRCSTPRAVRNAKLNAFSELQFVGWQVWLGWSYFNCCSCTLRKSFALLFDFLLWEPAVAAFFFFFLRFPSKGRRCPSTPPHSTPLLSSISIYLCINCSPKLLWNIPRCHCCICFTHMEISFLISILNAQTNEGIQAQMHVVDGCDLRSVIPSRKVRHLMMPAAVALAKSHSPKPPVSLTCFHSFCFGFQSSSLN